MPTYACVICGRRVEYQGKLPQLYPFCGERCQLVDLGRWFREEYSVDRDLRPEDLSEFGGQPPGCFRPTRPPEP